MKNKESKTPLIFAIEAQKEKFITYLINHGVNINDIDLNSNPELIPKNSKDKKSFPH